MAHIGHNPKKHKNMDKPSRKPDRTDRKAGSQGSPSPKPESFSSMGPPPKPKAAKNIGSPSPKPRSPRSPGSMPALARSASTLQSKKRSVTSLPNTTLAKPDQSPATDSLPTPYQQLTADLGVEVDEDDTRDFSQGDYPSEDSPIRSPITFGALPVAPSSEPLISGQPEHEGGEDEPPRRWTPTDDLEPTNWLQIEQSHQEHMQRLIDKEQQLWQKLARLNALYEDWARAGHEQELQRGHKRLRTRIAYVTHHEQELFQAQAHYKSVRAAFKSALESIGSDVK